MIHLLLKQLEVDSTASQEMCPSLNIAIAGFRDRLSGSLGATTAPGSTTGTGAATATSLLTTETTATFATEVATAATVATLLVVATTATGELLLLVVTGTSGAALLDPELLVAELERAVGKGVLVALGGLEVDKGAAL